MTRFLAGSTLAFALLASLHASAVAAERTAGGDVSPAPQKDTSPREVAVSCRPIRTAAQLDAIRNNLAGSYCLAADIDAGAIANFVPIGTLAAPFTGKLFGNNHVIRNLTIKSDAVHVGLFGYALGATIQDLGLVNVNVTATASEVAVGGLAGFVEASGAGDALVKRVTTAGQVRCAGVECYAGGIAGVILADGGAALISDSWSAAKVSGKYVTGGAVGYASNSTLVRTYATGAASCTQPECFAGGLIGIAQGGSVTRSFATGAVTATDASNVGGLVGLAINNGRVRQAFATGPVRGLDGANVGGLIGTLDSSTIGEVFATGRVGGGVLSADGGLIGRSVGTPTVTSAYWDTVTTGQATSAGGYGAGLTTAQLRAALPPGFDNAWAVTRGLSYPFLDDADIGFAAPLAMLVDGNAIYTFLPIGQRVQSEYLGEPAHSNEASLAAVYTMIARAVGITNGVPVLRDVKIDKYFWDDTTETASWQGPVTRHASLGPLVNVPRATPIALNVIRQLNLRRAVILRGTYTKSTGGTATHWMLATLYTKNPNNRPAAVVAHDPWTGSQLMIDPNTKKVIAPSNFPLSNFTVDGYQPVIISSE
jgi:hypothetical protein